MHTTINSLPRDLLVDVVSRVASSSFTDLFNTKFCCRDFKGAAEEDSILEQVCIEKFPVIHQWLRSDQLNCFMNRCMSSGNPEALFRQGMVEYFTHMRTQSGLENLTRATDKGHLEATYVLGNLLLCMGGEPSVQGSSLLNAIERIDSSSKLHGSTIFQECREKIKPIFRSMWINNRVIDRRTSSRCHPKAIFRVETWEGWHFEVEQDDGTRCEICKWDTEVKSFCSLLQ